MSWRWVQHIPSTAYTQDSLSSCHFQDYELTPECSFSLRHASLHDRLPSASSASELKGKVAQSHSHGCELTDWWQECQHLARGPSTASQYSSILAWLRPPRSHDHGLQVHLHTRLITISECISKFTRSRPPSVSPDSLDHGLQAHLQTRSITASKCISKLTWLWSSNSLDHGLQVHLQTRSITASKFARSCPPSASIHSLVHNLEVHL